VFVARARLLSHCVGLWVVGMARERPHTIVEMARNTGWPHNHTLCPSQHRIFGATEHRSTELTEVHSRSLCAQCRHK
jgi:hypothetical protein